MPPVSLDWNFIAISGRLVNQLTIFCPGEFDGLICKSLNCKEDISNLQSVSLKLKNKITSAVQHQNHDKYFILYSNIIHSSLL